MTSQDYGNVERPMEGVQFVENVDGQPGVDTIEGKIGTLLWGQGFQSYFLDMPAGCYLDEHPHPFEAVVYAVRGSYVLTSRGQRCLMRPGSIMAFEANVPTGYEVPFDESSLILVFRGAPPTLDQHAFMARLEPYRQPVAMLRDLPADHPARVFAQQVNPTFK